MKGLIIKDIMCLKKQLTTFVYVISGVVVISILYVLSSRFGNLAKVGKVLLDENNVVKISDDLCIVCNRCYSGYRSCHGPEFTYRYYGIRKLSWDHCFIGIFIKYLQCFSDPLLCNTRIR